MIDEKKLIKDLKEYTRHLRFRHKPDALTVIRGFMHIIHGQPKTGEWIPCSERLPEGKVNPISNDYYEYPVTVALSGGLDVKYYKFGDGHWWHSGKCMDDYVIAWIPRPEP